MHGSCCECKTSDFFLEILCNFGKQYAVDLSYLVYLSTVVNWTLLFFEEVTGTLIRQHLQSHDYAANFFFF